MSDPLEAVFNKISGYGSKVAKFPGTSLFIVILIFLSEIIISWLVSGMASEGDPSLVVLEERFQNFLSSSYTQGFYVVTLLFFIIEIRLSMKDNREILEKNIYNYNNELARNFYEKFRPLEAILQDFDRHIICRREIEMINNLLKAGQARIKQDFECLKQFRSNERYDETKCNRNPNWDFADFVSKQVREPKLIRLSEEKIHECRDYYDNQKNAHNPKELSEIENHEAAEIYRRVHFIWHRVNGLLERALSEARDEMQEIEERQIRRADRR